jgi:hypothetical protein
MGTQNRIERLNKALYSRNASIFDYLNPGKPLDELLLLLNSNGILPNESLIAVYEWHNGVRHSSDPYKREPELIPNGSLYSLEYMISRKRDILDWGYLSRPENYLPFIGSLEDDLYLLKNTTGEIYYLSPAVQIFGEKAFGSIDSMLDFIIECYEEEILPVDQGNLENNFDRFYEKLRRQKTG